MDPLKVLPKEMLSTICSLLPAQDLLTLGQLNQAWRRVTRDPAMWKHVTLELQDGESGEGSTDEEGSEAETDGELGSEESAGSEEQTGSEATESDGETGNETAESDGETGSEAAESDGETGSEVAKSDGETGSEVAKSDGETISEVAESDGETGSGAAEIENGVEIEGAEVETESAECEEVGIDASEEEAGSGETKAGTGIEEERSPCQSYKEDEDDVTLGEEAVVETKLKERESECDESGGRLQKNKKQDEMEDVDKRGINGKENVKCADVETEGSSDEQGNKVVSDKSVEVCESESEPRKVEIEVANVFKGEFPEPSVVYEEGSIRVLRAAPYLKCVIVGRKASLRQRQALMNTNATVAGLRFKDFILNTEEARDIIQSIGSSLESLFLRGVTSHFLHRLGDVHLPCLRSLSVGNIVALKNVNIEVLLQQQVFHETPAPLIALICAHSSTLCELMLGIMWGWEGELQQVMKTVAVCRGLTRVRILCNAYIHELSALPALRSLTIVLLLHSIDHGVCLDRLPTTLEELNLVLLLASAEEVVKSLVRQAQQLRNLRKLIIRWHVEAHATQWAPVLAAAIPGVELIHKTRIGSQGRLVELYSQ